MSDFTIRADSVDVEQIMRQIRARIRDKRGVDYTEEQIQELAAVKLERFLDPQGVRSDLLEQFRRARAEQEPPPPNYAFEDTTLYESNRGLVRALRRLLQPILKLFFNPNPLIQTLHIQAELNKLYERRAEREALYYELIHNLAVELTRVGIEVNNVKMRLESIASRLDFDERRARALEGVVQYRPGSGAAVAAAASEPGPRPPRPDTSERPGAADHTGDGQRSRRRRRRRGRRGGPTTFSPGASPQGVSHAVAPAAAEEPPPDSERDGTDRDEPQSPDQ